MKKLLLLLLCVPLIGLSQQTTYVPDDDFELYLENNGMGNGTSNDDYVLTSAIDTLSELHLGFFISFIYDLTGIEDFVSLKRLSIVNQYLTTLDVSQNILLEELSCYGNQLTNLNLSNNTSLIYLACYDNQLTNLNVSQNSALNYLWCSNNQITSLDVTQNNFLNNLVCNNNQITYLDLTSQISFVHLFIEGNNLTSLDISHMQCPGLAEANLSNPNLFCIQVTDVSCWYQPFTSWMIDTTFQYFSANCSGTAIQEHTTNKELLKVTDLLGRETKQTNQPLFYIYDDGTVEKRIVIE